MTATELSALDMAVQAHAEAAGRAGEARRRAAELRAKAAAGERVPGAALAAAEADAELADLAAKKFEADAVAEQAAADAVALEAAVEQFVLREDQAVAAFMRARQQVRLAEQGLREARVAHAGLVASFTSAVPVTVNPAGPAYRSGPNSPAVIRTAAGWRTVQHLPSLQEPGRLAELEARFDKENDHGND